ncbi:MAG: hypothetical protein NMNS02_12810 [Nitrosomonas sp.]|nr:MAG: hypothetical protein NMNS02_12810 [Nitrosomonas sp.]
MSLQARISLIGTKIRVEDLSNDLHDLLTDDADWNANYWDFDLNRVRHFVLKVSAIYSNSTEGITFAAIWPPDDVEKTESVSFEQLSEYFLSNHIGTRTKYIVKKARLT